MYVVSLTYQASLEAIDDALEAHRQFLDTHFAAGVFIAAGPKVPREGGVILAAGIERAKLDAILATDPFAVQGLAAYAVTEFKATRIAPGVQLHPREA
ncbi:YciI family protein [Paraburkholderia sp. J12]|uniref:YciI family protein n=1 Tax=Paraburkholderia sp. J12 TaxID=2805432 RepID=UPI002ABE9B8B|nr:YciI family protein [Paraburkholderia sp. J12]